MKHLGDNFPSASSEIVSMQNYLFTKCMDLDLIWSDRGLNEWIICPRVYSQTRQIRFSPGHWKSINDVFTHFNQYIHGANERPVSCGGYIQCFEEKMLGKASISFPTLVVEAKMTQVWPPISKNKEIYNSTRNKMGHGMKTPSVHRSHREAHELCVAPNVSEP